MSKAKAMVAIKLLEMSDHGLQLIAKLPTAEPIFDEEEYVKGIAEMTENIAKNTHFWLSTDEVGFNIPKMQEKTIVVKGVFELIERETKD